MRRLLIASDFSEHSAAALRHGAALARIYGAEVELYSSYSVGPLAIEATELTPSFWKQLESDTRTRLEQQAAPLRQIGLAVSIALSAEDPSAAIARRAREATADLIALGTRGRSGLAHVVLGSVAERVARIAPCPVLTAHAEHPDPDSAAYRRIAVGTDFSPDSEAALAWARDLAARTGGEIRLIHCVPPPVLGRDPLRDDAWMQELVGQSKQKLTDLARPGEAHDVLRGHLHVEGLDAVRQMRAELLVVGTRGLTGLAHVFLGSNSERVIRVSPVPVVTVKADSPAWAP